jgi:hypothetical protein
MIDERVMRVPETDQKIAVFPSAVFELNISVSGITNWVDGE